MSAKENSPLISRFSLRELAENPHYEGLENFLHGARQLMLAFGLSFYEAIKVINRIDILNRYQQLMDIDYFNIKLKV